MRGFLILLAILVVLLGFGFNAIEAHADQTDDLAFIADARAAGFAEQDDQDLLRNGYIVCALRQQSGADADVLARGIAAAQRFLGRAADPVADEKFVSLAVTRLCPDRAPQ